jgi:hypothetical protein
MQHIFPSQVKSSGDIPPEILAEIALYFPALLQYRYSFSIDIRYIFTLKFLAYRINVPIENVISCR